MGALLRRVRKHGHRVEEDEEISLAADFGWIWSEKNEFSVRKERERERDEKTVTRGASSVGFSGTQLLPHFFFFNFKMAFWA